MHATQTFCVAAHVAYYLTADWPRTGRTSADRAKAHNRYPLVWIDQSGRQILLGGHHRSMAALIQARPVRCRVLRPTDDPSVAVLPLLLAGPSTPVGHIATTDPVDAAAAVTAGRTALVPDLHTAAATLAHLDFDHDLITDRITMATTGRCRLAA